MKEAIVIGAGAGGAAAARELAGAYHVTLLEQGGAFKPFGYRLGSFERMRMAGLFVDPHMITPLFPHMHISNMGSMPLVWGTGLGGTTTLATGNALRYDGALRELGIDTVIAVGEDTNICVLHTLADAYFLGYASIVVEDATRTFLCGTQEAGIEHFVKCYGSRIATADEVVAELA